MIDVVSVIRVNSSRSNSQLESLFAEKSADLAAAISSIVGEKCELVCTDVGTPISRDSESDVWDGDPPRDTLAEMFKDSVAAVNTEVFSPLPSDVSLDDWPSGQRS